MPIIGSSSSGAKPAPTVPTSVSASNSSSGRAFNNGAASVSFTAPSTSKLPVTSYTVTSSPGSFTASGASSPLTVTGLQSNTAYTYTVTATSAAGTSSASSASSSVTATTVPQAPTIGSATAGTDATTQVNVAFTGNATGGSAITGYTATSSPGGITGTGASSPITVSGLSSSTAYTFTVTATNANGTSAASSASSSITTATPTSFESIATASNTGTNTYTFSSIPQTYKSLQIRIYVTTVTNGSSIAISPNGSSPAYTHKIVANNGSTTAGGTADYGLVTDGVGNLRPGCAIIDIIDYASTTKWKTIKTFSGVNSNAAVTDYVNLISNLVTSTTAITSLTFSTGANTNYASFALYGVK